MSELRKANTDATYFITISVVGWIDVFTRSKYSDVLVDSLRFCMDNKDLEIYAYVIMTSHIHLIVRQLDGRLNETIRDFKSFTAKEIIRIIGQECGESRKEWLLHMFRYQAKFKKQNRVYQFWQKTNHPIALTSPEMIRQKRHYIHENPVQAGLVVDATSWKYSSANAWSPLKVLEG